MTELRTITMQDILAFVLTRAERIELDRINAALNERNRMLRTIAAASVKQGDRVTLENLKPKYLNGLQGVVETLGDKFAAVRLDGSSTDRLRTVRTWVPTDSEAWLMEGVPLSSCAVDS